MSLPTAYRPAPEVGDILWCTFPQVEGIKPGPKNRPALVLAIEDDPGEDETGNLKPFRLRAAYGTASFTGAPRATEFDIDPTLHPTAFKHAGLSYPTRFQMQKVVMLNYDDMFFALKPNGKDLAPGPTPILGALHASHMKFAHAAYLAVIAKGQK